MFSLDGEVREEVVALEHHADVAPQLGARGAARPADFVAADRDAAALHRLEPGDAAQQRALARAAAADDGNGLAARHVEADAVEHAQRTETP